MFWYQAQNIDYSAQFHEHLSLPLLQFGEGAWAKNHVFYYYYVDFQFIAMHQRIYFTDKLKQVLKWIMEIIKTIIST